MLPISILDPNRFLRELLQVEQLGIRREIPCAQLMERRQARGGDCKWGGESFAESKGGRQVGIVEPLNPLREDLITNGGQFVAVSSTGLGEFIAMLDETLKLSCGFCWGNGSAY